MDSRSLSFDRPGYDGHSDDADDAQNRTTPTIQSVQQAQPVGFDLPRMPSKALNWAGVGSSRRAPLPRRPSDLEMGILPPETTGEEGKTSTAVAALSGRAEQAVVLAANGTSAVQSGSGAAAGPQNPLLSLPLELREMIYEFALADDESDRPSAQTIRTQWEQVAKLALVCRQINNELGDTRNYLVSMSTAGRTTDARHLLALADRPVPPSKSPDVQVALLESAGRARPSLKEDILPSRQNLRNENFRQIGREWLGDGHKWPIPLSAVLSVGSGVAAKVLSSHYDTSVFDVLYIAAAFFGIKPVGNLWKSLYHNALPALRQAYQLKHRPELTIKSQLGPDGAFRGVLNQVWGGIGDKILDRMVNEPGKRDAKSIAALLNLNVDAAKKGEWMAVVQPWLGTSKPGERGEAIEAFLKNARQHPISNEAILDMAFLLKADLENAGAGNDPAYARAVGALALHLPQLPAAHRISILKEALGTGDHNRGTLINTVNNEYLIDALAPLKALAISSLDAPEDSDARQMLERRLTELELLLPDSAAKQYLLAAQIRDGRELRNGVNGMLDSLQMRRSRNWTRRDWQHMIHAAELVFNHDESPENFPPRLSDHPQELENLQRFYLRAAEQCNSHDMAADQRVDAMVDVLNAAKKICTRHTDLLLGELAGLTEWAGQGKISDDDARRAFDVFYEEVQSPEVFSQGEVIVQMANALRNRMTNAPYRSASAASPVNPDVVAYFAKRLDRLAAMFPDKVASPNWRAQDHEERHLLQSAPLPPYWKEQHKIALRADRAAEARALAERRNPSPV